MLAGDFLNFVAFDVVTFQNDAVIGFAVTQNAFNIDGSHVHARRRLQFGECLSLRFAPEESAVNI